MRLSKLFNDFFNSGKAGGLILISVTFISLFLANSNFETEYSNFWHTKLGSFSIEHWINEGLMTIFFLLIGLELEREIYNGELSDIKKATLPIFGAIGGMLIPAGFFLLINSGTDKLSGAGIPMATDIAFAIGILSLLGNRVPASLKVFLTALAVIDDVGAILVIAIFYTSTIDLFNLSLAIGIFGLLLILNRLKVLNLIPYILGGIFMWYFMVQSGVHSTLTGVLVAFAIPFGSGKENSPSYILQHFLHKPVAFFILPLFALANTCISLGDNWLNGLEQTYSIGIIAGLVAGKPLGIWLFSYIGARLGWCSLPEDLNWKNILSAGFLGGIGFTMSIFITLLAFNDTETVNNSKMAILVGSLVAGATGFFLLKLTLRSVRKEKA
jgi:NhaA family Na+:H+ antiporter